MNAQKDSPSDYFTADHRACDRLWAEVEGAVDAGDATAMNDAWKAFDHATRRHLTMEEEVLFPAFEQATGMVGGPTHVMRMEHEQMRGLLDQMGAHAEAGAFQDLVDHGDTLLMLTQQHNQKEEAMLYPMTTRVLSGQWSTLLERLTTYQ